MMTISERPWPFLTAPLVRINLSTSFSAYDTMTAVPIA